MLKKLTQIVMLIACFGFGMSAHAILLELSPDPTDGKDAQISNGSTTSDQNFGTFNQLIINWFGNSRSIGLIEFDLGMIPSNATITSAELSLFHLFNLNLGSQYDVFRVTSPWDESTVTFNTAPTYDPAAVASLLIPDSGFGVYRDWDITSLVNGWVDGTYDNYGMWIEEIPVQGTGTAYFASSDSGVTQRPILRVNYSVPEPVSLALFGLGLTGLGFARRKKSA